MDLNELDLSSRAEEGAWMNLPHPTTGKPIVNDDGTPWRLRVLSKDAKAYRRKAHAVMTADIETQSAPSYVQPADWDPDARNVQVLAACVIGWEGLVLDKSTYPYSSENAEALLRRFYWILKAVDVFSGTRANYLGNA